MKTLRTEWERTSQEKANICSTGTTENSENLTCRQITLQLSNLRRTIANRIELFRSDMQISPQAWATYIHFFFTLKKRQNLSTRPLQNKNKHLKDF